MIKIVHLDDDPLFREKVRKSLVETLRIRAEELEQFGDLDSFYRLGSHNGDIYISDRHFPKKQGENPDDNSWRTLAGFVTEVSPIYPNKGMILLTGEPPEEKDWRRYKSIKEVVSKDKFNDKDFGELVKYFLEN